MRLTDQQKKAAYAEGSVAVTAGAGTGKTHMLVARYLHLLEKGLSPLQIVAVTFTEKAATELRSRIRTTIATEISDRPDLLAELEAAQICTFHALAARICREHPDKANVPPNFVVQDTIEGTIWQAENFAQALASLPENLYETIPFGLMQEILRGLLADPITAEQALSCKRENWLPTLVKFRRTLLENVPSHNDWIKACRLLDTLVGPANDKREISRQKALELASAFESTLDESYLTELKEIGLRGGSHQKWSDRESFDAVKDTINALKDRSKKTLSILSSLEPNQYDDKSEMLLPVLREAFTLACSYLQQTKYQQRILNFSDLEVQALKALEYPDVQHYYHQRWHAFLIDEFQDTNPTQGQFLEKLTANATLTIVGDVKQSIYGFRRADVSIFEAWQQRIHPSPKKPPVLLNHSFRTHRSLIIQINQVFEHVLGDLHQPLDAARNESRDNEPTIQWYLVSGTEAFKKDPTIDTSIDACRHVEAGKIADLVDDMLAKKLQVYDKSSGELRPIRPADIVVLARTWAPLEIYGNAISSRNIPILQMGGGHLLETREAKDALALLRFLADPSDDLSLVAVLRSPLFAVSDRVLVHLVSSLPEKTSWWQHLVRSKLAPLERAVSILKQLLVARRTEAPTRLLQLGDRLTGYSAVIANLPDAKRRLADWTGFSELVRSLEDGNFDVLDVVRRLRQILAVEVQVPRPALEAENAVTLMTIHASKGLEWPVVIVPDLSHRSKSDSSLLQFDADLGVALKLPDQDGNPQKSALYTLLEQQQSSINHQETKRIYYVAFTRARDQLILTSASGQGGNLDFLKPGLNNLADPIQIEFQPVQRSRELVLPDLPMVPKLHMVHSVGLGLSELPVTALSEYALCPLRFKYRYLDGHPGVETSQGLSQGAREIGILTHRALELGISDVETLRKQASHLPLTFVEDAISLTQKFLQSDTFTPFRKGPIEKEKSISLTVGNLTLNGWVDLVGEDFVVDFKTDSKIMPEHYQFQLWAYARATESAEAHLAYLRHDHVHSFTSETLLHFDQQAKNLVQQLMDGNWEPQADRDRCKICPYAGICDSCSTILD